MVRMIATVRLPHVSKLPKCPDTLALPFLALCGAPSVVGGQWQYEMRPARIDRWTPTPEQLAEMRRWEFWFRHRNRRRRHHWPSNPRRVRRVKRQCKHGIMWA